MLATQSNADLTLRYKSEVSQTLHRINRLVIPPYLLLISYLAFFADHINYPEFYQEMFWGRLVSMIASGVAFAGSLLVYRVPALGRYGHPMGIICMSGVAFMITHFAAVMQNEFSAQTAWIVGNIIIGGLYPVGFGWSLTILAGSYVYYLAVYAGYTGGPYDLQFQMALMNSGIAGVTALAIKYGFIAIRKREFFSRVRLEQANQQIASLNEQLKDENLRMSHELDVARRIQHIVLPSGEEYRDFSDLDIACAMVTADEVGGDYYDIIRFDERNPGNAAAANSNSGNSNSGNSNSGNSNSGNSNSGNHSSGNSSVGNSNSDDYSVSNSTGGIIAIGDVTGHGLNSGVLMMMVHATLRALSEIERQDLRVIYRVINKILYDFRIKTEDTRIMTLALLRYFGEGRFTLTGEHESILRIKRMDAQGTPATQNPATAGGTISAQGEPLYEVLPVDYAMYAGLEPDIREHLELHEFQIAPGETLILYTDGITEAVNEHRAEFGELGIVHAARQAGGGAHSVCEGIMRACRLFAGEHSMLDDYSLVVIQRRT
jgi:serine phosphatase RsbU (regulator of sigma subunit)